jgi:hypothetical protein
MTIASKFSVNQLRPRPIGTSTHAAPPVVINFPQNNHFVESRETAVAKVVALRSKQKRTSNNILRKVPSRPKKREVRSREHLLPDEVDALIAAAG